MENFRYEDPADMFVGGGRLRKRYPMAYKRFATGAEAVRFAIELQSAEKLIATVVESGDDRFGADAIRELYESDDYPLQRQRAS